jgi:transcriptional regulator with XRE-family HTH domain
MNFQNQQRREQLRTLGINISRIREEHNISQIEMAYMLGYTNHAHLSRVESGKTAPSIMVLLRIADILDVRVETFFEGV